MAANERAAPEDAPCAVKPIATRRNGDRGDRSITLSDDTRGVGASCWSVLQILFTDTLRSPQSPPRHGPQSLLVEVNVLFLDLLGELPIAYVARVVTGCAYFFLAQGSHLGRVPYLL